MKKTITVLVQQRHIDKGEPNSRCCPIGLALRDQGYTPFHVGGTVGLPNGDQYLMSYKGVDFMTNFDAGEPVKPNQLIQMRYLSSCPPS